MSVYAPCIPTIRCEGLQRRGKAAVGRVFFMNSERIIEEFLQVVEPLPSEGGDGLAVSSRLSMTLTHPSSGAICWAGSIIRF